MLSFQAYFTESDIESYARSLVLPTYMSHLTLDPFRLANQDHNGNGRVPLRLYYSALGRLEEFMLTPEEHAAALLQHLTPSIAPQKIRFSPEGALWNWDISENEDENSSKYFPAPSLRILFQPLDQYAGIYSLESFTPQEAYVSISRREIFIATSVLAKYILARYRYLLIDPNVQDFDLPKIQISGGIYHFQFGALGGTLNLENRDIEEDLILYANLKNPLHNLSEYLNEETLFLHPRFDETGVHFPLAIYD